MNRTNPTEPKLVLTQYRPFDTPDFFGTAAFLRGQWQPLANFVARITEQEIETDGETDQSRLVIHALFRDRQTRTVTLTPKEFAAMQWPLTHWGTEAILYPGEAAREHLKTCIQQNSRPTTRTVYTATGWQGTKYIASGVAIDANGRSKVATRLPPELTTLTLADPDPAAAHHLFALIDGVKPEIALTILAAIFRAPISPTDFAIHLHGTSGVFKTEYASLAASAWGTGRNARNATNSWSSTVNALEALAYYARETVMLIDDFAPQAAASVGRLNADADRIFRAAGNQAGRARLGDGFAIAATRWPRSLIISTGEDIPTGQSVRARMLNIDVTHGDIDSGHLTHHQRNRDQLAPAFADYLRWLATDDNLTRCREKLSTTSTPIHPAHARHKRTSYATRQLQISLDIAAEWAATTTPTASRHAKLIAETAPACLERIAAMQSTLIQEQTYTDIYLTALRTALRAGDASLVNPNGTAPPRPTQLGWRWEKTTMSWTQQGKPLGWADEDAIYLDPDLAWTTATRKAKELGTAIAATKATIHKRLVDEGLIAARDQARQRTTIRRTLEGRCREVLAIRWDALLDAEDVAADQTRPAESPDADTYDQFT